MWRSSHWPPGASQRTRRCCTSGSSSILSPPRRPMAGIWVGHIQPLPRRPMSGGGWASSSSPRCWELLALRSAGIAVRMHLMELAVMAGQGVRTGFALTGRTAWIAGLGPRHHRSRRARQPRRRLPGAAPWPRWPTKQWRPSPSRWHLTSFSSSCNLRQAAAEASKHATEAGVQSR